MIDLLSKEFLISTDFIEKILINKDALEKANSATSVEEFKNSVGDGWKQIGYALSTNARAESSLARMLSLDHPEKKENALDLGCGYGGFMQAFGKRGFAAFGVEIDSNLAKLAELNLKNAPFKNSVIVGDFYDKNLFREKFDLITVNDVIEHLMDPIAGFNRLAEMLAPGGLLAIYAPNGDSIFNVISDPHNRVFGSSYLPGSIAKQHVQNSLNTTGYGLGEYLRLSVFRDLAKRNGLTFKYRPHDGGERPENSKHYLSDFILKFSQTTLTDFNPAILAKEIETHLWDYIHEYSQSANYAAMGEGYCEFNDRFLARAWTIVCKKTSAP